MIVCWLLQHYEWHSSTFYSNGNSLSVVSIEQSPKSTECRLLAWSGRHLLCGLQAQHNCIGRTKLKIGKAHRVYKKISYIYCSIYMFENGQQSRFPCFSLYSAFEAHFRNSWSPTWILALPPFLSFLNQVLYSTQQCFSNSWHCRKILFEAAFPFPHFEISVFPWFLFSCCPVLSAFLTDFWWTFSDFLTLLASRQWFASKVSLSANTFQQWFLRDNKCPAELWIWECRKGGSRRKKVWCPEIRFLSLSQVRQPSSSVPHLWTAGNV